MIDEKILNETARAYVDATYGTLKEEPLISEGFRQGAKWAEGFIKELLKRQAEHQKPLDRDISGWVDNILMN